jgi:lysophospholipase L1-like esterase
MNHLELGLNLELYRREKENTIKITIMLLSENKYGGIGIKNINVYNCNNNQKAIRPETKKKLSIEFIGDSMTCAYGVEGKDENEHFKTSTENYSKSYAYLAAKLLDVDYSTVSYSGYGIASGYSLGEKNAEDLVSHYYKKIGRHENYPGEWNFKKYKNDIIFINLGANDYNYYLADPEKRGDEFIQEYIKFLNLVKECNPDSLIICTLGNINKREINALVEKAVQLYGDEKVVYFKVPDYKIEGYGSDWHPSVSSQEKISKFVADNINEIIKKYYNN